MKNVVYLHSITGSSRYSFELKLKHKEHLERIVRRQHELIESLKYKKGS